ncbi:MAG: transporter substrate-binding domain-containing protein [Anaerovoracaceae bacterium]
MKKLLVFALTAVMVLSAFTLTGCGGDKKSDEVSDWKYIEKNGKLVVGLDDTFAPMGFRDKNDKLIGFDIDLATAVSKELGVEVEFKPIDWDAKDLELKTKKIDCIWNGMSATEERQEAMSLSNKYINNKIVLMGLDENVKIENANDLTKYKIGTQADSSALEMLNKNEKADQLTDKISEYKTYDEAILDLKAGRVDVIAVDQVLGEYKNTNMKGILKTCKYDLGDDFYAIGFRKADTELTQKVNDAIKAVIDSGEAEKISKKWFGKNIVVFEGYDK